MAQLAGVTGPWGSLDERLRSLERREGRNRRAERFEGEYDFRVAPTCPPTTSLHVRGGRLFNPVDAVDPVMSWVVPNLTIDLTDGTDTVGIYAFANAGYYAGAIITLASGYPPDQWGVSQPIWFWCNYTISGGVLYFDPERATAAEAEDDCVDLLFDRTLRPCADAVPLCALVLRNDGTTDVEGAYMPVDAINRGRSYIFQDIRYRGHWVPGNV